MNVWCDFCVEEVHGMSDLIELKRVTEKIIEENSDFDCVSWRKSWRCESQMASRQKGV